jgi:hypothetical protein
VTLYDADSSSLSGSVRIARDNWRDWRDVFEHDGPIHSNPLLVDQVIFSHFCQNYNVSRTIRHGKQNELRIELLERYFLTAIPADAGRAIDDLEMLLRPRFGTHDGKHMIVGVLSKVAALVRPERFVARDQFARKGINIVLCRKRNHGFTSYADYLSAFEQVWQTEPGQRIRDYITKIGAQRAVETESRFQRRVLDVDLMRLGGRSFS